MKFEITSRKLAVVKLNPRNELFCKAFASY